MAAISDAVVAAVRAYRAFGRAREALAEARAEEMDRFVPRSWPRRSLAAGRGCLVTIACDVRIAVTLDRGLVERLLPGVLHDAEIQAQGFSLDSERRSWLAGRVGAHLEALLSERVEALR